MPSHPSHPKSSGETVGDLYDKQTIAQKECGSQKKLDSSTARSFYGTWREYSHVLEQRIESLRENENRANLQCAKIKFRVEQLILAVEEMNFPDNSPWRIKYDPIISRLRVLLNSPTP